MSSLLCAYLGKFVQDARETKEPAISSFVFLQAFATACCGIDTARFDGESQQDAGEFVDKLFGRLEEEERLPTANEPTFVKDLFGVDTCRKVSRAQDH